MEPLHLGEPIGSWFPLIPLPAGNERLIATDVPAAPRTAAGTRSRVGMPRGYLGQGSRSCWPIHVGSIDDPIKNLSTACAARRPSRMAHTTSDWPRRISPAANTLGSAVL